MSEESMADPTCRRGDPGDPPVPSRVARSGEVLATVRQGLAMTTSQLATALGVSRSMISERVAHLARSGLLVESSATSTGRGRPSTHFAFNAHSGLALVAQMGMSGARVAVTDLGAAVLRSHTIDADLRLGPDEVMRRLIAAFDSELARLGMSRNMVRGVGVGLPGRVELTTASGPFGPSDHP